MGPTAMILVRILIAKITDMRRLMSTLRAVPIRADQAGWNCVEWLKEALKSFTEDGKVLCTSVTDWKAVRDIAMNYVEQKRAEHRFDEKAMEGQFDVEKVSTYDLLKDIETIS